MIGASHPFQVRGLNVRDENGNEGCAACGRVRGVHPESEATRMLTDFMGLPEPSPRPAGPVAGSRETAVALPAAAALDGVALIKAERARQISEEGYTPQHDAEHGDGELIRAAVAYATDAAGATWEHTTSWWPWPLASFKPDGEPLDSLVKAGALIAAELDRIIGTEGLPPDVREYRALVGEDGEQVILIGPCAETIGCLFHRDYDSPTLGQLIDAATEHEGEQGRAAHAHVAEMAADWDAYAAKRNAELGGTEGDGRG